MVENLWPIKHATAIVASDILITGMIKVSRATIYAHQKPRTMDENDLLFRDLINEEYTRHPFYGSRKTEEHVVNRKRVQSLMRKMGLAGMAPGPNTSCP